MEKINVNNSCRLGRTSQHVRTTGFSTLGLLLMSAIAITVTLPMTAGTRTVDADQYSRLAFRLLGCKGTYNQSFFKALSQMCYDHSNDYQDSAYTECRKSCFTTAGFRSSAAMRYFQMTNRLQSNGWVMYSTELRTLTGTDPQRFHG